MSHILDQVEAHILSGCTGGKNRAIGAEIETIFYNNRGKRIPVNPSDEFSATEFIAAIDSSCKDMDTFMTCSLEPGGQLEWASHPAYDLHKIQSEWQDLQKIIETVCINNKLTIVDLALDPIYSPSDIKLIDQRKYRLMHNCFTATGKHGSWMMRNTASVQVNIDLLDRQDAEESAFIADCISPLAAILFSNAPFINSQPLGYKNIRYRIWEDTDPDRCGHLLDHGMQGSAGLLTQYCRYVMNVPVIFTTPDTNGEAGYFMGTIQQWLEGLNKDNVITQQDVKTAIHQIFTHNRFKTVLELRSSDRPPQGFELAPAAFWLALMEHGIIRDTLLEAISHWTLEERTDLNLKAASLEINRPGPGNKTILQWLDWLVELVYTSLDKRAERLDIISERQYIEPFIENILTKGVFTLQIQEEFVKSGKTVKDFIMDRNKIV